MAELTVAEEYPLDVVGATLWLAAETVMNPDDMIDSWAGW
jgi:hypothetical protein